MTEHTLMTPYFDRV